jgi:hypothetical protein
MNHETMVWAGVYAASIGYGDLSTVAKAKADQAVNDFKESLAADFKPKE